MNSCSPWRHKSYSSGASAIVSACAGGVELRVIPHDWVRKNGPARYEIVRNGKRVGHGQAKTLRGAKSAARRRRAR